jgi:hypothetical protein
MNRVSAIPILLLFEICYYVNFMDQTAPFSEDRKRVCYEEEKSKIAT